MKKQFIKYFLILCLIFPYLVFSQKIYSVEYESLSDVKVYVVDYESQSDLKVFKVDYPSEVNGNKGFWGRLHFWGRLQINFISNVAYNSLK